MKGCNIWSTTFRSIFNRVSVWPHEDIKTEIIFLWHTITTVAPFYKKHVKIITIFNIYVDIIHQQSTIIAQHVNIMYRSLFEKRNNTIHRLIIPSIGHEDNDNNMCLMSTKYRIDVTIIILSCRNPYKTRESCSWFAPVRHVL